MYEMCDVLVEGVVATRNKSIGASRLPSPTALTFVVGFQGPVATDNSMGPPALVVNNSLTSKILEVADP